MVRMSGVVRPEHRRITRVVWDKGWTVVLPALFIAISIAFWRALAVDTSLAVASQVDQEDAALCVRFGFAAGTEAHDACKLDLLELRRSDRQLAGGATVP